MDYSHSGTGFRPALIPIRSVEAKTGNIILYRPTHYRWGAADLRASPRMSRFRTRLNQS
jgi:hypothetical protein